MSGVIELQRILVEMEKLNNNIEQSQANLADKQAVVKATTSMLESVEAELGELETRKRKLKQQLLVSKNHVKIIVDRLADLVTEANQLKAQLRRAIVTIADEYIGKKEGVHLINGKLAIARIINNDTMITRIVPVMARASPKSAFDSKTKDDFSRNQGG